MTCVDLEIWRTSDIILIIHGNNELTIAIKVLGIRLEITRHNFYNQSIIPTPIHPIKKVIFHSHAPLT